MNFPNTRIESKFWMEKVFSWLSWNKHGWEAAQGRVETETLLPCSFCETATQAQWLGSSWEDAIFGEHCVILKANRRVIKLILSARKIKQSGGEAPLIWMCGRVKRKGREEHWWQCMRQRRVTVKLRVFCEDVLLKWQIDTYSFLLIVSFSPDAVISVHSRRVGGLILAAWCLQV